MKQANPSESLQKLSWLPGLFLVAAAIIAYQPVWRAGFIMDDEAFLVRNPYIRAPDGLYWFWLTTGPADYFPLTSTSLWLEWRLWGANPLGYHLVNVALHAISAVLLWRILLRLKIPGAWLAAAIFTLHPVAVQSVAWVTERKNTLAMALYLLSVLAYLRFQDNGHPRWYWGALGAFVLALLSKSAVAPFPLVLLGLAWWRRGRIAGSDARRAIPFFAASAALGLVTIWFQYHRAIGPGVVRTDAFASRLAGAGCAFWFYLFKAVAPFNLIFVYPRWRIVANNPLVYAPDLLLLGTFAVLWIYRRQWGGGGLFALGYFLVMLLPVLGFINIYFMKYSLVADHWQYFAIIGPIALAAAVLTNNASRAGALSWALPALLLFGLGAMTWRQARIYRDAETLWRTTLDRNPDCCIAHIDLGCALLDGRVDEAMVHFRRALEIQPNEAEAHYNLGLAFYQKGMRDQARLEYEKAVECEPRHDMAQNNLGNLLLVEGRLDDAIACYRKALEIQPESAEAHNNLGRALLAKGQTDEAMAEFRSALNDQPDFAAAHHNFGNALLRLGRMDEAMSHYKQALAVQPANAEVENNMGWILLQKGRANEAVNHFEKALALLPQEPETRNNLGMALLQKGQPREAITQFEATLALRPDHAAAQKNLAWILATSPVASIRDGTKAVALAESAHRLSHDDPRIITVLAAAYAESGRFPDAIATAQRALDMATAQSDAALIAALRQQLALYQSGKPFRE